MKEGGKWKSFLVFPLALFVISVTCMPYLMAQTASTGALSGTITDPSGAVVVKAEVGITNLATGQSQTTTTGQNGAYRFSLLTPGKYKVRIDMAGFKRAEFASVTINVTETSVLNCTLEVGAPSETYIVQSETEILQTASSTLGTLVDSETITSLPLTSRNYTQILDLSTGVTASVHDATVMGKGTQYTSVNGATPAQNNYQMDGVGIVNIGMNGSAGDQSTGAGIGVPNPDAIQEFKVQTSTFDASYGRNPGGNVNVVTKSGSNELHGSAFEFLRNTSLNANPFFYNRDNPNSATTKPILNQNQFGFVLGGPVVKERFFLFGSYQGSRQKNGLSSQGLGSFNLPPIPGGDRSAPGFAAALAAANCSSNTYGPKLACDGSNINPVALKILQIKLADGNYYVPGSGTTGYKQFAFSDPARYSGDQYLINSDLVINPKQTLQTRYFYTRDPQTIPLGGKLPGQTKGYYYANHYAVLKLNTFVTNAFTNEAHLSYQRNQGEATEEPIPGSSPQELGMKPAIPDMTDPPQLAISGAFSLFNSFSPALSISESFQGGDQIAWSHNKHTVRAGFEYERVHYFANPGFQRGYISILSFNDFLVGQAGNLFMCIACSQGRGPKGTIIHGYRMNNISGYVQDDWKLNRRLTLNLGVRWEYFGTFSDKYGNLTNTWPDLIATVPIPPTGPTTSGPGLVGMVVPANNSSENQPVPEGVKQVNNNNSIAEHPPYTNFGPRVGFAWQMTSKGNLVLRGGFGLFYDRVWAGSWVQSVQEGSPYAIRGDYSAGNTQTLQTPFRDVSPGVWQSRWSNLTCLPDGTGCTGTSSNISAQFLATKVATPLMRQYTLMLGYEFARNWVLEAGYVGSSGTHLINEYHNKNTARLATPTDPINGQTANTLANRGLRVPYLGYQTEGLKGTEFNAHSNYNSLQATIRKRFSYGLALQGSYTWSKSLSDEVGSGSYYSQNSNDPDDPHQQYGPSDFDRTQRFIFNYQYELPLGTHQGTLGKLLNGWSVAGITTLQSGTPITITDSTAGSIYGSTGSRAQMCSGATHDSIPTSGSIEDRLGGNSGGSGYINKSAFCTAPTGGLYGNGYGFGDSGVGILRAPGQSNWDITLVKVTHIGEGHSLQFRTEFYNAFNHAQFAGPTSSRSSASFGNITATSVNPRIIQFGLKYSF
jgi:hypothetical protein